VLALLRDRGISFSIVLYVQLQSGFSDRLQRDRDTRTEGVIPSGLLLWVIAFSASRLFRLCACMFCTLIMKWKLLPTLWFSSFMSQSFINTSAGARKRTGKDF